MLCLEYGIPKSCIFFSFPQIAAAPVRVAVCRVHSRLQWRLSSVLLAEDPALQTVGFVFSCCEAATRSLKHGLKAFSALTA